MFFLRSIQQSCMVLVGGDRVLLAEASKLIDLPSLQARGARRTRMCGLWHRHRKVPGPTGPGSHDAAAFRGSIGRGEASSAIGFIRAFRFSARTETSPDPLSPVGPHVGLRPVGGREFGADGQAQLGTSFRAASSGGRKIAVRRQSGGSLPRSRWTF